MTLDTNDPGTEIDDDDTDLVVEEDPAGVHVVSLAGHVQGSQTVLGLGGDGRPALQHRVHYILVTRPAIIIVIFSVIITKAKICKDSTITEKAPKTLC